MRVAFIHFEVHLGLKATDSLEVHLVSMPIVHFSNAVYRLI